MKQNELDSLITEKVTASNNINPTVQQQTTIMTTAMINTMITITTNNNYYKIALVITNI